MLQEALILVLTALVGLLSLLLLKERWKTVDNKLSDKLSKNEKPYIDDEETEEIKELDLFLKKYHLQKHRTCFLKNGLSSLEMLCALDDQEMKGIGLMIGHIKTIKNALRDHETTKGGNQGTTFQKNSDDQMPKRRTKPSDYNPATPTEHWKCRKDYQEHDVFISYRVDSDEYNAMALYGTLAATPRDHTPLHPYLDNECLCDAMPWEQGFINGLYRSNVIVLILSEAGLRKTLTAHDILDNQFLEIQHALKRLKECGNRGKPIIQPIFMWSTRVVEGEALRKKYFPKAELFPNYTPIHEKSPLFDSEPMTIRGTIIELMKLQALDAADEYALKRLVPNIRELITKASTADQQGDVYTQGGSVVLTADQDSLLRSLLDPIDSTSDGQALEDLYVEGTRQWLFDQTTDWVNQDTNETVLWVNAVAGVGKSVAAAQIANILTATNQLVSALFLKYNDIRKSDPRVVLNTIAYGLCKWYSPISRKLLDTGHSKDNLDKMSIPELFKAVIADPLEAIGDYRPKGSVMILVDALDECSPRDQLLSLLAVRFVELNKTRPWLKLLLTSRPEDDIKAAFDGVPTKTIEPSSEENVRDLEVFIRHRLRVYDTLTDSDRTEAVAILLDQSKTFVWINLILNTVDAASTDGPVTLATIKDINDSAADVGQLYNKTFAKIHSQSSHPAELVTVVSAIATAQSILTPQIIADVFGLEIGVVRECLKSLSLVLDPGANGLGPRDSQSTNNEVKFNHKSVADYLLGDASTGHPWHVSDSFHMVFAQGCLGVILSHEPVINICDIFEFHDKIADLEDRVADKITPSLRYSVAHWITHFVWCVDGVAESSPVWQSAEMVDVAAVLTRFVKTHVFFWLECGSLTHVVKPIIEQLAVLRGVTNMAPSTIVDDTTKELVKDTYRFIREFADPIIKSAPQVYNSGYAFTPKETAIYRAYADQLEGEIPFEVKTGLDSTWGACESTLLGHMRDVKCVAISSDGKWIVSGSKDATIKVWDVGTGQEKLAMKGHTSWVNSVAISPDGKWIASGSRDRAVKVWDTTTGQLKHTLEGHVQAVNSVAISPDGKSIVSGSSDKTIKIWDATTSQLKNTLIGHRNGICSVSISPDSKSIVSGSFDKTIRMWNVDGLELYSIDAAHSGPVDCVVFSPDGSKVISGSSDSHIKIWNASTQEEICVLTGHNGKVTSIAISPDCNHIISGSFDSNVVLWDLRSNFKVREYHGHTQNVRAVAISQNGRFAVSGSGFHNQPGEIKIWDLTIPHPERDPHTHSMMVMSVCLSKNKRFIVSGSSDGTVRKWRADDGSFVESLWSHEDGVASVAISNDGEVIASGAFDGCIMVRNRNSEMPRIIRGHSQFINPNEIKPEGGPRSGSEFAESRVWDQYGQLLVPLESYRFWFHWALYSVSGDIMVTESKDKSPSIWNTATGENIAILNGHTDDITAIAISADGRSIATGSKDCTIKMWEVSNFTEYLSIPVINAYAKRITLSKDGQTLAVLRSDGVVQVWKLPSTTALFTSTTHNNTAIDIARDASFLIIGSRESITQVDLKNRNAKVIQVDNLITSVAILPDGKEFVTGSVDKKLRKWNVGDMKQVGKDLNHKGNIRSIIVSEDGCYIVVRISHNDVIIWKRDLTLHQYLSGHAGSVRSVALTPDGQQMVSAADDTIIKVYDMSKDKSRNLYGHRRGVYSIDISPTGHEIVSASDDNTIRCWNFLSDSGKLISEGTQPHVSISYRDDTTLISRTNDNEIWERKLGDVNDQGTKLDIRYPLGQFAAIDLGNWRLQENAQSQLWFRNGQSMFKAPQSIPCGSRSSVNSKGDLCLFTNRPLLISLNSENNVLLD